MSKEHKSGREDKKKPQMTAKEKRVAKRHKKSGLHQIEWVNPI